MTDRIPLDHLTSDQLDALYQRIAVLEHVAASNKRHVRTILTELESADRTAAEAQHDRDQHAARVIDLYERWVKAGPPPLGTSVSRWWDTRLAELHTALSGPQGGPETPGVAEEASEAVSGRETGADGFGAEPTPADEGRLDREYWTQRYDQPRP